MHAVTGEHSPAASSVVMVAVRMVVMVISMGMFMAAPVFVTMVPKFGLVQQKEEHQSNQQGQEQVVW